LENGLIENELDYVFTGIYDGPLEVNELEVSDWKFLPIHSIKSEILNQPDSFTHWFKIIMRNWEQKAA
jgi:isopentenyl-diphosphate delta-isomerase